MLVSDSVNKGLIERVADLLDMDIAPSSSTHPTKGQIQSWLRDGYVRTVELLEKDVLDEIFNTPSGSDGVMQLSVATINSTSVTYDFVVNDPIIEMVDINGYATTNSIEFLHVLGVHENDSAGTTREYKEVKNIRTVQTSWTKGVGYWSRLPNGFIAIKIGSAPSDSDVKIVLAAIPDFSTDGTIISERIAPLLSKFAFATAQYQDEDEQSSLVNMKDFYQEISILNRRFDKNAKLPD